MVVLSLLFPIVQWIVCNAVLRPHELLIELVYFLDAVLFDLAENCVGDWSAISALLPLNPALRHKEVRVLFDVIVEACVGLGDFLQSLVMSILSRLLLLTTAPTFASVSNQHFVR